MLINKSWYVIFSIQVNSLLVEGFLCLNINVYIIQNSAKQETSLFYALKQNLILYMHKVSMP